MDFINPAIRMEFCEFCVSFLALRQIEHFFQEAGLRPGRLPPERHISGQRRTLVEEYYAAMDWANPEDARRFLDVIGLVLSQSYIPDDAKNRLRAVCSMHGLVIDGNTVRLGAIGRGAAVRNLIFAANGPKPEIVLADSTTNEIRIVANEQNCLVYDRPILQHGLLWRELVE